jgi:anti-sigma B factor antagonist
MSRPVVVKRMPEKLNFREARIFFREVQPILTSDRPQVVFDLSQVKLLDSSGVDMLLQCMAEIMKRDGDLKLAAMSPQSAVVLEMTRADRLFEMYETSTDAVRSFSRFLPGAMRNQPWGAPGAHPESLASRAKSPRQGSSSGGADLAA